MAQQFFSFRNIVWLLFCAKFQNGCSQTTQKGCVPDFCSQTEDSIEAMIQTNLNDNDLAFFDNEDKTELKL